MSSILRKRLSIAEKENHELTSRVRALENRLIEYAYIDQTVRKRSINELPMELKFNCVKVLNDELIKRVHDLEERVAKFYDEKNSVDVWRAKLIECVKLLGEQNGGREEERVEEHGEESEEGSLEKSN
jgi:hypothetical protein